MLQWEIAPLLIRPVGRPPKRPVTLYDDFWYRAESWDRARRVVAKVEWHRGELFPRVGFIVTNMTAGPKGVVRFYNGRGTAEQWIKEGKYAQNWTRLSCHRFVANRVRLSLFVLAYNLGNFLRRLYLTKVVKHWSLRSVQVKLIKMGRPFGAARAAVGLSVVRGVGSSTVVPGTCWIVSAGYRRRQAEGEYNHDLAKREGAPRSQLVFNAPSPHWPVPEDDKGGQESWFTVRIASPHRIDRRLTGLAGPDYDAPISLGLSFEPEDCQYGTSRLSG